MKIGIDIDEVLAEQLESLVKFYEEEKGVFIPKEKFYTYKWYEVWDISLEEAIKIDNKFKETDYFDNLRVVEGAKESLKIISKSHEILILTSRPNSVEFKTIKWLNENFKDSFSELIHSSEFHPTECKRTKGEICVDLKVDLMIEDSLDYALDCANKGIKVFLLDKPWNQGENHELIIRVDNWRELLVKLEEIKYENRN